jgi:phi13 family phage major tail protein
MPGKDKVKFGIKNVHYALLDTSGGTPTFETPVAIPGAVSLSLDAKGDSSTFYADDTAYFVTVTNNGYTGELEMALFPAQFLQDVFGYVQSTTDKVMTEMSNVTPKPFALLFEEEGDQVGTKYVLYNVTASRPSRSMETTSDTTEPKTQSIEITASPLSDNRTLSYTTDDTPQGVLTAWYNQVWVADTTGGGGV